MKKGRRGVNRIARYFQSFAGGTIGVFGPVRLARRAGRKFPELARTRAAEGARALVRDRFRQTMSTTVGRAVLPT
jgi:hypothetical protein